jgi:hypothetical protein
VISPQTTTATSQLVMLQLPLFSDLVEGSTDPMNQYLPGLGENSNNYVVPAGQNLVATGLDRTAYSNTPANILLIKGTDRPAVFWSRASTSPDWERHDFTFRASFSRQAGMY